jgi:microcystin-dependent protein
MAARLEGDASGAKVGAFTIAQLLDLIRKMTPIGSIQAYGGDLRDAALREELARQGWLPCDGSAVSRVAYPQLFAALKTSFGAGDGSQTFNLPDFRGRFLRGVDGGAGNDPDRASRAISAKGGAQGDAVGSLQDDAFKSHAHPILGHHGRGIDGDSQWDPLALAGWIDKYNQFWKTAEPAGGSETRPKNVDVYWIIKGRDCF